MVFVGLGRIELRPMKVSLGIQLGASGLFYP